MSCNRETHQVAKTSRWVSDSPEKQKRCTIKDESSDCDRILPYLFIQQILKNVYYMPETILGG